MSQPKKQYHGSYLLGWQHGRPHRRRTAVPVRSRRGCAARTACGLQRAVTLPGLRVSEARERYGLSRQRHVTQVRRNAHGHS